MISSTLSYTAGDHRVPTWALLAVGVLLAGAIVAVDEGFGWFRVAVLDLWMESTTVVAVAIGWLVMTAGQSRSISDARPVQCGSTKEKADTEGSSASQRQGKRRTSDSADLSPAEMVSRTMSLCGGRHFGPAFALYKDMTQAGVDVVAATKDAGVAVEDFFKTVVVAGALPGQARSPGSSVIDHMRRLGVSRSPEFYESVLRALTRKQGFHAAADVYEDMVKDGVTATSDAATCAVTSLVEVGAVDKALSVFQYVSAENFQPTIRVYMFVLKPLHAQRRWEDALELLSDMRRRGVQADALCMNMVLSTMLRGNRADMVVATFKRAREDPAVGAIDCVSLNTAMLALVRTRASEEAMALMESAVLEKDVSTDCRTYRLLPEIAERVPHQYRAAVRRALVTVRDSDGSRSKASELALSTALDRVQGKSPRRVDEESTSGAPSAAEESSVASTPR
eukprot:CAMPEP_0204275684 /NCGR_PEP_ID=MMETSP0468-20130131/26483_1 /ASSEMBLY_ACC=CAM_ASM_000383 /TAXON_ID=2969 /ORGANISM="Oxyrrhis marina" /LENGTH=451 /DNA_ID=CAMNT_0051252089 /DNA_START=166 /DNA_END=1521 /DNA_ORIENTATION=-